MLKESRSSGGGGGGSGGGGGGWARLCDSCRLSACAVYCQADSAYLCTNCDARVHAANHVASRHERVWVCEACESAPAAFSCKADAAALCTTCDAEIHSANPLARRHQRIPILPIHGCLYRSPSSATHFNRSFGSEPNLENGLFDPKIAKEEIDQEEDEDETGSWLLLNPLKNNHNNNNQSVNNNNNNGYLFGGEVDEYLDLVEYNNSCNDHQNQYLGQFNPQLQQQQQQNSFDEKKMKNDGMSDSVVPVNDQHHYQQNHYLQLEMDYENSKAGFNYTTSISHTVSLSSMDTSIVPDSTTNDISNSHSRPSKGTIDLFSSPPTQMLPHFSPMDREARVLRYREKRKTRKFEKTIRYASRKAYAETRPRIKGRFAKRTDVDVDVDVEVEVGQMFSNTVIAESGYGIVPSF